MKKIKILPNSFFRISTEKIINLQLSKKYEEASNLYFDVLNEFLDQDVKSDEGIEWLSSILDSKTLELIASKSR